MTHGGGEMPYCSMVFSGGGGKETGSRKRSSETVRGRSVGRPGGEKPILLLRGGEEVTDISAQRRKRKRNPTKKHPPYLRKTTLRSERTGKSTVKMGGLNLGGEGDAKSWVPSACQRRRSKIQKEKVKRKTHVRKKVSFLLSRQTKRGG